MIQCTEPTTPADIVCCELPVSLQEAVLGLKTPSPITVLSERGEGFFRLFVSVVPPLWKRADQKKKDRSKQYSGRRRQMQAVSLDDVTQSLVNNIPLPNLSGRLSQDVDHGL